MRLWTAVGTTLVSNSLKAGEAGDTGRQEQRTGHIVNW